MAILYRIFIKELRQYIHSPIAYIVGGVFHLIVGFFFYNSILKYAQRILEVSASGMPAITITPNGAVMEPLITSMGTLFILLTPLMTMRLLAEEKRARTIELLLTSPVSVFSVVMGKFLAAFMVYSVIILFTLYMPLALDIFSQVYWPQVFTAYLGLLLVGAAMLSVGVFASALTEKQVIAAVLAIGMLVMFWFVGGGIGSASLRMTTFMADFSLFGPFDNMVHGLLDLRDVVVLGSYIVLMLFFTHRVLESSRW